MSSLVLEVSTEVDLKRQLRRCLKTGDTDGVLGLAGAYVGFCTSESEHRMFLRSMRKVIYDLGLEREAREELLRHLYSMSSYEEFFPGV